MAGHQYQEYKYPDLLKQIFRYLHHLSCSGQHPPGNKKLIYDLAGPFDYVYGINPKLTEFLSGLSLKIQFPQYRLSNFRTQLLQLQSENEELLEDICFSGSTSENFLGIFGSDLDIMFILTQSVFRTLNLIQEKDSLTYNFLVESPAYVRLSAVDERQHTTPIENHMMKHMLNIHIGKDHHPLVKRLWSSMGTFYFMEAASLESVGPSFQFTTDESFLSDTFFEQKEIAQPINSFDLVFAIRIPFKEIEPIQREWITRIKYKNCYVPDQIVDIAQSFQCYLVPVGINSDDAVHWRISFSEIEKVIMLQLDQLHRDVYIRAKKILNLCSTVPSFYLKTTFLWFCEDIPKKFRCLRRGNELVRRLLQKLFVYINRGNLPHYFIPKQNLLDGKSAMTVSTYRKQYSTCIEYWKLCPFSVIISTGRLPAFHSATIGNFVCKPQPNVLDYWHVIQGLFLDLLSVDFESHVSVTQLEEDKADRLVLHLVAVKQTLEVVTLCSPIPLSALFELFCAASFLNYAPKNESISETSDDLIHSPYTSWVTWLVTSFKFLLTEPEDDEQQFIADTLRPCELTNHEELTTVCDIRAYLTRVESYFHLRIMILCLFQLQKPFAHHSMNETEPEILEDSGSEKSGGTECGERSEDVQHSGYDFPYVQQLIRHFNDVMSFVNLEFLREVPTQLYRLNVLHFKLELSHINNCILMGNLSSATRSINFARDQFFPSFEVEFSCWEIPVFEHCPKLHEHMKQCGIPTLLGIRSIRVKVGFIFDCLLDTIDRVLVYDKNAWEN